MQAVIFDCDGVLVDSELVATNAVEALVRPLAPGLDLANLRRVFAGLSDADMVDLLRDRFGVPLPDDFLAQSEAAIDRALIEELEAIPRAAEVVRAVDLPKAVASNSHRARVRRSLARAGLTAAFGDHLYCADMVAQPKPAPDVYLAAAAGLGADPQACVAVEDSPTGTAAAVAAGMAVIGFLGGGHIGPGHGDRLRTAGAHWIADDMGAVAHVLTSLRVPA